jgi:hypothetical protein
MRRGFYDRFFEVKLCGSLWFFLLFSVLEEFKHRVHGEFSQRCAEVFQFGFQGGEFVFDVGEGYFLLFCF